MGVISTDQEALQHNRIVHSLLGIISDLPDGLELEELQAPDIKSRPQEEINKETIRKKEDRPSPPQVEQSPKSVRDSDRLRKGNYYLYLPSKMLLNQAATCLVRVIPEGSEFEEGMVRNMTSQPGLISEEMTISMLSPSEEEAFHIQPLSANQKTIVESDFTDWVFQVQPHQVGTHPLVMKLSLTELVYGQKRKKEIVLEQTVEVLSDVLFNSKVNSRGIKISQSIVQEGAAGRNFGLIVGVGNYRHFDKLGHPLQDAKRFKELLDSKYAFEEIIFLEDPQRDDLIDALDELEKKLQEKDSLLVFYAGHGYWEDLAETGFWLLKDAEKHRRRHWVSNSTLQDYLKRYSKCQHVLIIADSCFSGSLLETRSVEINEAMADIQELFKKKSRQAMTSGAKEEVPDRSPFFKYLFEKLEKNNEEFLSSGDLFHGIRQTVIRNSKTGQTPQLGKVLHAGDDGGDFIFMRK